MDKLKDLINKLEVNIDYESCYPKYKNIKEWVEEWDFKKFNINLYTHKIHDYPAMFIPQLARKIIEEFTNEGDTILDIFSGSGTTVLESHILKRNGIGIDLNPLAILISKVKTTPISKNEIINSYKTFLKNYDKNHNIKIKEFANINFWFSQKTIEIFSKIYETINLFDDEKITNLYKIAFSSIIRKLSYCNHNGFKMHKDKNKTKIIYTEDHILDYFHESLCKVSKGINDFTSLNHKVKTNIITGDSRIQELDKQVDLILTSPPYGDSRTTVAYGEFSKLQSLWLGLISENEKGHIENIDKELLGGKIISTDLEDKVIYKSQCLFQAITTLKHTLNLEDKKNIIRIKDVISFYHDLDKTIKQQSKYLKNEGIAVFVVASRTVKNIQLNTDLIISELAKEYGLKLEAIYYRSIPNKRMPHKVSATNIKGELTPTMDKESIVILKKSK